MYKEGIADKKEVMERNPKKLTRQTRHLFKPRNTQ